MQPTTMLQRYEFSIMPAYFLTADIEPKNYPTAVHLPLMRVNIDFEHGKFLLDGDWRFLVSVNKYAQTQWLSYFKGRVTIDVSLYPPSVIDLSDPDTSGLVLPAEGFIKDGCTMQSCSGIIILDKVNKQQPNEAAGWAISFYLYDYQMDVCEINYTLPVYLSDVNEINN